MADFQTMRHLHFQMSMFLKEVVMHWINSIEDVSVPITHLLLITV